MASLLLRKKYFVEGTVSLNLTLARAFELQFQFLVYEIEIPALADSRKVCEHQKNSK